MDVFDLVNNDTTVDIIIRDKEIKKIVKKNFNKFNRSQYPTVLALYSEDVESPKQLINLILKGDLEKVLPHYTVDNDGMITEILSSGKWIADESIMKITLFNNTPSELLNDRQNNALSCLMFKGILEKFQISTFTYSDSRMYPCLLRNLRVMGFRFIDDPENMRFYSLQRI